MANADQPWRAALLIVFALLSAASAQFLETTLSKRANQTDVLLPLSVTPSQAWDGIDGAWSSFSIGVGTPAQYVRVFASWMSYQTLLVHPAGCLATDTACPDERGGIYRNGSSTSFDYVGLFDVNFEANLGLGGNAFFGYDTITLGGAGQSGLVLKNNTIGSFAVDSYWLGFFGVNPKPTNWTTFENGATSLMTNMREQSLIPSVSFGYTAGAPYRFTRVLASLTLGGYDASRFEPNGIEYTLAGDNSRDTVVAIQAITTNRNNDTSQTQQLLPSPIFALMDATVPQIWLPTAACQAFEQEFGLIYDDATSLYLVNNSLHDALLRRNPTISFKIGPLATGASTTIDFPYAAFDLTAKTPYQGLRNNTFYFPLRRAQNDTQYTLGRAFMQEAYISVDYERARFNVSKVKWQQDITAQLIGIYPPNGSTPTAASSSSSNLPIGAIVGIVVGAVVVLIIASAFVWWSIRKRRAAKTAGLDRKTSRSSDGKSSSSDTIVEARPYIKSELDSESVRTGPGGMRHTPSSATTWATRSPISPQSAHPTYSSNGSTLRHSHSFQNTTFAGEADGTALHELPGDMPETLADSKQITEKDMMRHRERQYNGVDPVEQQVREEEDKAKETNRRTMINAEDVREATEEEGGRRRFSFTAGEEDHV